MLPQPLTIEGLQDAFAGHDYVCDRALATSVFLALRLGRLLADMATDRGLRPDRRGRPRIHQRRVSAVEAGGRSS